MQDWLLKRGNATVQGKLEGTIGGGGGGFERSFIEILDLSSL